MNAKLLKNLSLMLALSLPVARLDAAPEIKKKENFVIEFVRDKSCEIAIGLSVAVLVVAAVLYKRNLRINVSTNQSGGSPAVQKSVERPVQQEQVSDELPVLPDETPAAPAETEKKHVTFEEPAQELESVPESPYDLPEYADYPDEPPYELSDEAKKQYVEEKARAQKVGSIKAEDLNGKRLGTEFQMISFRGFVRENQSKILTSMPERAKNEFNEFFDDLNLINIAEAKEDALVSMLRKRPELVAVFQKQGSLGKRATKYINSLLELEFGVPVIHQAPHHSRLKKTDH